MTLAIPGYRIILPEGVYGRKASEEGSTEIFMPSVYRTPTEQDLINNIVSVAKKTIDKEKLPKKVLEATLYNFFDIKDRRKIASGDKKFLDKIRNFIPFFLENDRFLNKKIISTYSGTVKNSSIEEYFLSDWPYNSFYNIMEEGDGLLVEIPLIGESLPNWEDINTLIKYRVCSSDLLRANFYHSAKNKDYKRIEEVIDVLHGSLTSEDKIKELYDSSEHALNTFSTALLYKVGLHRG